ncbi:MAG: hypothetical protein P8Z68_05635, partial [Kineosporiaceae bacterium]
MHAPAAPGRLGAVIPVAPLRDYLDALGRWRDGRRIELDRLDEAARAATDPDSFTGDVTLSMALWQAVSDRYELLVQEWDSGRADDTARERLSRLIWGRLDASTGAAPAALGGFTGFGVSLVEACRLSDALVAQLRARLSFDPRAADAVLRVKALRAAVFRLEALAAQEPEAAGAVARLAARVRQTGEAAARGGDVSGVLPGLEADAARTERDLIVRTATRQQRARDRERESAALVADRVRAMNEAAALERRQHVLLALADRCAREVVDAPRLAVPEPEVLGPVPEDRAALDGYLARLGDIARAMDHVERVYSAPLVERDGLRGQLGGYRTMAARTGRDADPEVRDAGQRAAAAVGAAPCDLA